LRTSKTNERPETPEASPSWSGNEQLLGDLLGGERIIAVRPILIDLTGSSNAAAMLSQAIYWTKRTKDPQGWFYKTREEWKDEIRLSRDKQESARKILRGLGGIWFEKRKDVPAQLYYRVDIRALHDRLIQLAGNQPTSWRKTRKQDGRQLATLITGNPQTSGRETSHHLDPETTTESTAKIALEIPHDDRPRRSGGGTSNTEAATAAFLAFGFNEKFGHPSFQRIVIRRAPEIEIEHVETVMERVIQDCQDCGINYPPAWLDRKHALEMSRSTQIFESSVGGRIRETQNPFRPEELAARFRAHATTVKKRAALLRVQESKRALLDVASSLEYLSPISLEVAEQELLTLDEKMHAALLGEAGADLELKARLDREIDLELDARRNLKNAAERLRARASYMQAMLLGFYELPLLSLYRELPASRRISKRRRLEAIAPKKEPDRSIGEVSRARAKRVSTRHEGQGTLKFAD
jgi:hypothetical protein